MISFGRAIRIVALLGCSMLVMGGGSQSWGKSMETGNDSILFKLASGEVSVDISALMRIKTVLQSFVDGPAFPPRHFDHRGPMSEELISSVPWIQDGEAGIGLWKLELRDSHLELIRRPPPSKGTQYIYHATLSHAALGWEIVS